MSEVILILIAGFLGLSISFVCSLMESSLFTVPLPYVKSRADQGSKTGRLLLKFKQEMHNPIAAVLIFNTISHTAAAAVVGAIASKAWGEASLFWVSAVYTLMILFLSEILPKQVGVIYARQASFIIAWPLNILIKVSYPMIWMTKFVDRLLRPNVEQPAVTRQEIVSLAQMGEEEGVLHPSASRAIHNLVLLDRKKVKDILTPRVVVFRLEGQRTVESVRQEFSSWNYTRIPLYDEENEDKLLGFVLHRDVAQALVAGDQTSTLESLARPLGVVPEVLDLQRLFGQLLESREPIRAVVDEHGTFTGLVTLEDVLEEIIGSEIVDESDLVTDLRGYAKVLYAEKRRRSGHI